MQVKFCFLFVLFIDSISASTEGHDVTYPMIPWDERERYSNGLFVWSRVVPGKRVAFHTGLCFAKHLYEKRCRS